MTQFSDGLFHKPHNRILVELHNAVVHGNLIRHDRNQNGMACIRSYDSCIRCDFPMLNRIPLSVQFLDGPTSTYVYCFQSQLDGSSISDLLS